MKFTSVFAVLAGLGLAQGAMAGDMALVLSNRSYEGAPPNIMADEAAGLVNDLRLRGYSVFEASQTSAAAMRQAAIQMQAAMERDPDADRVVIAVTGYFANAGGDGWLLQSGAGEVSRLNVGARGLSLTALAGIAGQAPGQAVMLIAPAGGALPLGDDLAAGPGEVAAPQGVSIVTGSMAGLRRWTRDLLMDPGRTLDDALAQLPEGAEASGFHSAAVRFAGGEPPVPPTEDSPMGEMAYWNAVRDIGGEAALRAYLNRYPQGMFADDARGQLEQQSADPLARVRAIEEALNLSRDARRQIQRNLSLLGFDPRGIDGVFGRGSRAAISAWQRAQGHEDHGFLAAGQVAQLQRQADVRATELEREAKLRREQEERADRAFWAQVGRDEAGLRTYLRRYPDGLFADDARARLDLILNERRDRAEARERQAWDRAREQDSIEAYQAFLADYPRSSFADAARERMAELRDERDNRSRLDAWRAEEDQVVPGVGAKILVEKLLVGHGQNPGPQDGKFTRETRKALRRFQKARDLPATGFVNQQTMVLLMLGQRGP